MGKSTYVAQYLLLDTSIGNEPTREAIIERLRSHISQIHACAMHQFLAGKATHQIVLLVFSWSYRNKRR